MDNLDLVFFLMTHHVSPDSPPCLFFVTHQYVSHNSPCFVSHNSLTRFLQLTTFCFSQLTLFHFSWLTNMLVSHHVLFLMIHHVLFLTTHQHVLFLNTHHQVLFLTTHQQFCVSRLTNCSFFHDLLTAISHDSPCSNRTLWFYNSLMFTFISH